MIEDYLEHNHKPDPTVHVTPQRVANACKRKATDDVSKRPSELMRRVTDKEALETLTEENRAQIRKSKVGRKVCTWVAVGSQFV